jgi:hypothetical protein
VSGGEWNTSRERKQLAADARELEREQIRLPSDMLRDLRYCRTFHPTGVGLGRSAETPPRLRQGGTHAIILGTGGLLVTEPDNERRDSMPQCITSRIGSLKLTAQNRASRVATEDPPPARLQAHHASPAPIKAQTGRTYTPRKPKTPTSSSAKPQGNPGRRKPPTSSAPERWRWVRPLSA